MNTFDRLESEVRSYCRSWPVVFSRALGSELFDESGRRYIDFFAGAGALNYGHNPPLLKERLLSYLAGDGIIHSLDMATVAKREFLERFEEIVLAPRSLRYKLQLPGPTGTNAVEAALKLARKVTGRTAVVAFTNAFHGMTLGSLALTASAVKRAGAGVPLHHVLRTPFAGYLGKDGDSLGVLEALIGSGGRTEMPAAIVVETVQGEGGVRVASESWLRRLAAIAERVGAVLIVDDIQVGCGRTGPFFSFEPAGITPDIVCLSKSLSGYGLPMSVVLLKPDLDCWEPGEHNGTFRGHNPAFVTATAALDYWRTDAFEEAVGRKAVLLRSGLADLAGAYAGPVRAVRGRGLILGVECGPGIASRICREAFERGLIVETAGPADEVVKLLPPLTTPEPLLSEGLDILHRSIAAVVARSARQPVSEETAS